MLLYPLNINKMSQNEQQSEQNQAEVSHSVDSIEVVDYQRHSQRLKTELYDCISKIVDEETLKLDAMATPQFTNALLELAWSHLGMSFRSIDTCLGTIAPL